MKKSNRMQPTVYIDAVPALRRRRSAAIPFAGIRARVAGAVLIPLAAAAGLLLTVGAAMSGQRSATDPEPMPRMAQECDSAEPGTNTASGHAVG